MPYIRLIRKGDGNEQTRPDRPGHRIRTDPLNRRLQPEKRKTETSNPQTDQKGGGGLAPTLHMTANQFRSAIATLRLSQLAAARLVGADPRTGRRWALGEAPVPDCVAILLRLCLNGKITVHDIEETGVVKY